MFWLWWAAVRWCTPSWVGCKRWWDNPWRWRGRWRARGEDWQWITAAGTGRTWISISCLLFNSSKLWALQYGWKKANKVSCLRKENCWHCCVSSPNVHDPSADKSKGNLCQECQGGTKENIATVKGKKNVYIRDRVYQSFCLLKCHWFCIFLGRNTPSLHNAEKSQIFFHPWLDHWWWWARNWPSWPQPK